MRALDDLVTTLAPLVGRARACRALGVNDRSHRHRRARATTPAPPPEAIDPATLPTEPIERPTPPATATKAAPLLRRPHPAALSTDEQLAVLDALCSDRFADLAPRQVYAALLDEDIYLCSLRSMHRLLERHGLSGERRRGRHQTPNAHATPVVHADRPNRAWAWDITKLRGPQRGTLYFLYTILDLYSRKIVGWTIALSERATIAEHLIERTIAREHADPTQLTLHADRGGPMTASSLKELLADLGVRASHNRPRVSNDNPHVEAAFKTLKYRPDYPSRFESLASARAWCRDFVTWYNHTHYHASLALLHPADLHDGRHHRILVERQRTLDAAYARHPQRFRRPPKVHRPPTETWINRPHPET